MADQLSTTKKILIVENQKAYSHALTLKLQNKGFEVQAVQNGEDALLSIWKAKFDLIVCDIVMPKMDGFEVLAEIKKQKVDVPVMVLCDLNQSDDEKKARDLGAVDFLVKSTVTINEVIQKVEVLLANQARAI